MKSASRLALLLGNIFALPAAAEMYPFGKWAWSDDNAEFLYAATINDSERFFGQYCYFESGDCFYLVNSPNECEPDSEHPALINSDAGAVAVSLICSHKYEDTFVYFVSPFEDVDNAVRLARRLGIVMPLEGDEFAVVRFDLDGSASAIDAMRAAAEKKMVKKPGTSRPADEEVL